MVLVELEQDVPEHLGARVVAQLRRQREVLCVAHPEGRLEAPPPLPPPLLRPVARHGVLLEAGFGDLEDERLLGGGVAEVADVRRAVLRTELLQLALEQGVDLADLPVLLVERGGDPLLQDVDRDPLLVVALELDALVGLVDEGVDVRERAVGRGEHGAPELRRLGPRVPRAVLGAQQRRPVLEGLEELLELARLDGQRVGAGERALEVGELPQVFPQLAERLVRRGERVHRRLAVEDVVPPGARVADPDPQQPLPKAGGALPDRVEHGPRERALLVLEHAEVADRLPVEDGGRAEPGLVPPELRALDRVGDHALVQVLDHHPQRRHHPVALAVLLVRLGDAGALEHLRAVVAAQRRRGDRVEVLGVPGVAVVLAAVLVAPVVAPAVHEAVQVPHGLDRDGVCDVLDEEARPSGRAEAVRGAGGQGEHLRRAALGEQRLEVRLLRVVVELREVDLAGRDVGEADVEPRDRVLREHHRRRGGRAAGQRRLDGGVGQVLLDERQQVVRLGAREEHVLQHRRGGVLPGQLAAQDVLPGALLRVHLDGRLHLVHTRHLVPEL